MAEYSDEDQDHCNHSRIHFVQSDGLYQMVDGPGSGPRVIYCISHGVSACGEQHQIPFNIGFFPFDDTDSWKQAQKHT